MADANFPSETVWESDNLVVLRGMNSECADLIYLDPPFNSNRDYEAPIGYGKEKAAFKDTWTLSDVDVCEHGELAEYNPAAYYVIRAAREAHGKSMQAYLIFMAVRLLELRRLLKPTGSIYLHCDDAANSYLRLLMDAIFGRENFQSEIIWKRTFSHNSAKGWGRVHDVILLYSGGGAPRFKRYLGDDDGMAVQNVITDIPPISSRARERVGYPTQKPLKLLERIVAASSNEGDMVLDPFCGCATTLVAADRLGRRWAGIDISPLAIKLVNERIKADRGEKVKQRGFFGGANALTDAPRRTDLGDLPSYRTHKQALFGKQEGYCAGCGTEFPFRVLEVDHVTPVSRGGTDHVDNLQLLCSACNRSKGSKTMAEWRAAQQ